MIISNKLWGLTTELGKEQLHNYLSYIMGGSKDGKGVSKFVFQQIQRYKIEIF